MRSDLFLLRKTLVKRRGFGYNMVMKSKRNKTDLSALVEGGGLFSRGDRVAAAVSGGSDSMCLLHLLAGLRKKLGFSLSCVHVNHNLRPEAEREEAFVREFCAENEIPFRSFSADVPGYCAKKRVSAEEGARALRYRCFEEVFAEGECDKIAIAHNSGDSAETVLFHLIRGCGARGARGLLPRVPAKTPGKWYVRPLLGASRAEISAYLTEFGVPHVEDSSNGDTAFSRNRLRLEALPALERAHPGAAENLCAFGGRMAALTAYLAERAGEYVLSGDSVALDTPEALLAEAAGTCLARLGADTDLSAAHLRALLSLETGRNGARVDLPNGVTAERRYDRICFFRDRKREFACAAFGFGTFELGDYLVGISEQPLRGGRLLSADLSAVPEDAVLRFPEAGDTFRKFGGGTKKLFDLFTDWKVPRSERGGIPVLASGKRVLCVFTRDISADLACGENSRIIYFCTQKKETNQ